MSRRPLPPKFVLVVVDDDRGTAYVTGRYAGDVLALVPSNRSSWRETARGWHVPADVVPDICAAVEYRSLVAIVRQAKR